MAFIGKSGPAGAALLGALLALLPVQPARAVTLTSLKGQGMDAQFGQYAPGGNCGRTPRLAIDASGFTFTLASGQTLHPARFEWAASYMGPRYEGIAQVFFPFSKSNSDFGPVVMTLNAEEKAGRIVLESESGRPLPAPYGPLVQASPYMRCGKAGAAARPAPPLPPSAPAQPLEWTNLPQAVGTWGRYDMFGRGGIAAALNALLGPKAAVLKANLSVSTALARSGNVYSTSGNAEHRGGYDMAYVVLDPAQRALEVGLWEGGKPTLYRTPGKRVALPADIAKWREQQPPEQAVAAPGPPWELRPLAGSGGLALGTPAASPRINTLGLYCDRGKPFLAMTLYKAPALRALSLGIAFPGGLVTMPMRPVNGAQTLWVSDLSAASPLLRMLTTQQGAAYLRLDNASEGEVSLAGAAQTGRRALSGCLRF
ncbi:MAG: hypothetical protein QM690_04500 [Sphingobium sp.]